MKPHKHAEIIKAWADGAEIEVLCKMSNEWEMTTSPSWHPLREYRIKPPEPSYGEIARKAYGTHFLDATIPVADCWFLVADAVIKAYKERQKKRIPLFEDED